MRQVFKIEKFRFDRTLVRIGWSECVVRFVASLPPAEAAQQGMMDQMRKRR